MAGSLDLPPFNQLVSVSPRVYAQKFSGLLVVDVFSYHTTRPEL